MRQVSFQRPTAELPKKSAWQFCPRLASRRPPQFAASRVRFAVRVNDYGADWVVLRPDPIPELKRQLATALLESLRGMTATEARLAIGLDPSRRSDLRHGRLQRFSIAQLIRLLARCGINVSIRAGRERL